MNPAQYMAAAEDWFIASVEQTDLGQNRGETGRDPCQVVAVCKIDLTPEAKTSQQHRVLHWAGDSYLEQNPAVAGEAHLPTHKLGMARHMPGFSVHLRLVSFGLLPSSANAARAATVRSMAFPS